jgi:catechol 2,3-dioxygenase-like lactoylglutathione lyase family enzyme
MSMTQDRSSAQNVKNIDMKVEVVVIPVSDVDRAKEFYGRLGWRLDQTPPGSGVVQFTPHGSGCSVQFGTNLTSAAPGSAKEYLIVSDIQATRDALGAAGVEMGEIFHLGQDGPVSGIDPQHEKRTGQADANWSDWYADYMVKEQTGAELPQ